MMQVELVNDGPVTRDRERRSGVRVSIRTRWVGEEGAFIYS